MGAMLAGFGLQTGSEHSKLHLSPIDSPQVFPGPAGRPPAINQPMQSVPSSWPSGVDDVTLVSGQWFVGQCTPGQEKAAAQALAHAEVDHYLPLVRGRKSGTWKALFPSYVFFSGTVLEDGSCEERHRAVLTHKFSQIINVHPKDRDTFVRQLADIQKAVNWDPSFGEPDPFKPGTMCRVKSGHSLADYRGPVVKVDGECFIYLNLDLLGVSKAFRIPAEFVESLS